MTTATKTEQREAIERLREWIAPAWRDSLDERSPKSTGYALSHRWI